MRDWLGNSLSVGDYVVYSSKSTHVGMVLGELTFVSSDTIKIRPISYSGGRAPTKIITLHKTDSAFNAVTRYFGDM
jgi:hypothetical protein